MSEALERIEDWCDAEESMEFTAGLSTRACAPAEVFGDSRSGIITLEPMVPGWDMICCRWSCTSRVTSWGSAVELRTLIIDGIELSG